MSNTDIGLLKAKILEARLNGLENNPELYEGAEKIAELLAKPEFLTDLEVTEVGTRGDDNGRVCSVRFEALREDGFVDVLTAEGQHFTLSDIAKDETVWEGELIQHDTAAEEQVNVGVNAVVEILVDGGPMGVGVLVDFSSLEGEDTVAELTERVKGILTGALAVTSAEGDFGINYVSIEDGISVGELDGVYTLELDSFALYGKLPIMDSSEKEEPELPFNGELPPTELGKLV